MIGKEESKDIAKSMAEMFKTGVNIGKREAQQRQQSIFEVVKHYQEIFNTVLSLGLIKTYSMSECTRRRLSYQAYRFRCFWNLVDQERICS